MVYWEHSRVIGAAILPFCVDPECGRLFFWLGKERYNAKWARGSEMWACFGGRPMHKSESPEYIAAREFVEETAGMLMYFQTDVLPRSSYTDIAASLSDNNFLFRLVFGVTSSSASSSTSPATIRSDSGSSSSNGGIYVVFVKQIHWDPQAARRFKACINLLNKLPASVKDPHKRAWLLEHPAIHLKTTPPQSTTTTTGKRELATHMSMSKHPCVPPCRYMCAARTTGGDAAVTTQHEDASPAHFVVDKDFMEKQEIALWSVPQMQRATRSNGVLTTRNGNMERCRSSFTRQIAAVLAEMSFYEPSILDERV
jgi:hypothetical protein